MSHNKTILILKRVCNSFTINSSQLSTLCAPLLAAVSLKQFFSPHHHVRYSSKQTYLVYVIMPSTVIAMMENWIICGRLNTWEEWGQLQSHGLKALSLCTQHTHAEWRWLSWRPSCHGCKPAFCIYEKMIFCLWSWSPFFPHRSQHLYVSDSTERNSFYVWSTSF